MLFWTHWRFFADKCVDRPQIISVHTPEPWRLTVVAHESNCPPRPDFLWNVCCCIRCRCLKIILRCFRGSKIQFLGLIALSCYFLYREPTSHIWQRHSNELQRFSFLDGSISFDKSIEPFGHANTHRRPPLSFLDPMRGRKAKMAVLLIWGKPWETSRFLGAIDVEWGLLLLAG